MLQVGIHDDDRVAPGMVEPGRDGDLLAEIAAEGDRADPRLVTADLADPLQGIVPAAVVDEDHLPGRGDAIEDRQQAFAEGRDIRALVVDGDDDAELGRRHWRNPF